MKQSFFLVLFGLVLHTLWYFSLLYLTHTFPMTQGYATPLYFLNLIHNNIALFIGVLIGFLSGHKSRYSPFLYGLLIFPVMLVSSASLGFFGQFSVPRIDLLAFLSIIAIIQATLGGLAGERIREMRKASGKK